MKEVVSVKNIVLIFYEKINYNIKKIIKLKKITKKMKRDKPFKDKFK